MDDAITPPDSILPALLDGKDAARLLHVRPSLVRAERLRGRLAYVRIGARIFYTPQLLADYLERQTVPACPNSETAQVRSEATGSARSPGEVGSTKPGTAP